MHKSVRTIFYYLLLICFSTLHSKAQDLQHPEKYVHFYDTAYTKPYPKRWDLIGDIRVAVFNNLTDKEGRMFRFKIEELAAKQHQDPKAQLICYAQKMDYLQLSSEVAINEFDRWYREVIEEANRLQFDEIKVNSTITYSNYLSEKYQLHALSLYYANKCYQYAIAAKEIRPQAYGYIYHSIANRFYKFDDFNNAILAGKEIEKYPDDHIYTLFTLDVIGMSYLKLKNYDSAIIYFNKDLGLYYKNFAPKNWMNGWQGILQGNKARAYKALGLMDSAIYNYQIAIDDTYKYNVLDNTCGFATNLADIYLTQNKLSEAQQLLSMAVNFTASSGGVQDKMELQQLLSKYYSLTGNLKLALLHKDSAYQWADSLKVRTGKNIQVQADLNLETEKRKNAETALDASIYNQKKNLIIAVVVILLLASIASFLLLRQRLLNKVKQKEFLIQQQETEKKLMVQEQLAKQEQLVAQLKLEEFTQLIIAKDHQIKLLEDLSNKAVDTESIEALKKSTILTNEQWDDFKMLFERVNLGFFDKLDQKLPQLTQAETRLLALTKLKLSTREMAALQGISTNAIRNIGYRLRKKYGLEDDISLESLVQGL